MSRFALRRPNYYDEMEITGLGFVLASAGTAIAIIGAIVGVCIVGGNHADHVSCLRLHEVTGIETRYVRSGGDGECYLHLPQGWVPESRWRIMDGGQ